MRILKAALSALSVLAAASCASTGQEEPMAAQQAGPIDEGAFVDINGTPQWITVRGQRRDNPVLLFLHGGPGFPMSQWAPLLASWEANYTIVQWDQPGGGGTFAHGGAANMGPLTIERYRRDGIAVAEWTRTHLGARKIILMGTSWGTVLGLEMIHARPELFSAYVGTAQAVAGHGDRRGYDVVLEAARARGDAAGVAALERIGPPPHSFENFLVRQQVSNAPAPREAAQRQAMAAAYAPAPAGAHYVADAPPYDFVAQFIAVQRQMYPEMVAYDVNRLGHRFEVPIFVFQGDSDLNTPAALARAWFDQVEAPQKEFVLLQGVGHDTTVFAPELLTLLDTHVRPVAMRAR